MHQKILKNTINSEKKHLFNKNVLKFILIYE